MKKTAIDHIYEQFISLFTQYAGDEIDGFRFGELITEAHEQSKEMEKQQIIDAYLNDRPKAGIDKALGLWDEAEQYYNETYNQ